MRRHHETTRRGFLQTTLAGLAGGGLVERACAASKGAKPNVKWPVACRDALLRETDAPDLWTAMDRAGIRQAEVLVNRDDSLPHMAHAGKKFSIAGDDGAKCVAEELTRRKKKIAAFCLLNRYDTKTEEEVAWTIRTAKVAARIGTPIVRIDLVPARIKDRDAFADFCIGIGKRLVEATKDLPVSFAVENHGTTSNRPDFLRKVFHGIGSKRFGLTMDFGNFYWFGHPLSKLYEIYAEFAPWSPYVHCKSIHYPNPADRERQRDPGWNYRDCRCPLDEGDIDYQRVARILRKADYRGVLCIDDESLRKYPRPQRDEVLARDVKLLRTLS